jgi:hypothetical protein
MDSNVGGSMIEGDGAGAIIYCFFRSFFLILPYLRLS